MPTAVKAVPGPLKPEDDSHAGQDHLLDEAVEAPFPASNPISPKQISGEAGQYDTNADRLLDVSH